VPATRVPNAMTVLLLFSSPSVELSMVANSVRSTADQINIKVSGFPAHTPRIPKPVKKRTAAQDETLVSKRVIEVRRTVKVAASRDMTYGHELSSSTNDGEKKKTLTGCQGNSDTFTGEMNFCINPAANAIVIPVTAINQEYLKFFRKARIRINTNAGTRIDIKRMRITMGRVILSETPTGSRFSQVKYGILSQGEKDMEQILLIVNPTSGRGFAGRSLGDLEQELKKNEINYDLVLTERPWHAADLAEDGARKGYEVVVIASGDGTANEVLNGLMRARQAGFNKTAMGQIALGTGNDFAFGMGIPAGIEAGCKILAGNYRRRVDVGVVKGGDYPEGRFFGNGVGIGFDAATGFVAAKIRWMRGLLLYLLAAIETIFIYYKAPTVKMEYDDHEMEISPLMLSIMNGRRMGGGFFFAPKGDPGDGIFDLCIARAVSQLRIFGLIPYFMKGTQATQKEVIMTQAHKVKVTAIKGTLPVHCDGETVCFEGKDLMVELLPAQIEFITLKPA
jgi:diacylglycerol kinase (ATP)